MSGSMSLYEAVSDVDREWIAILQWKSNIYWPSFVSVRCFNVSFSEKMQDVDRHFGSQLSQFEAFFVETFFVYVFGALFLFCKASKGLYNKFFTQTGLGERKRES